jgi:NADH:ubiquinone reductase (H+-translocating)
MGPDLVRKRHVNGDGVTARVQPGQEVPEMENSHENGSDRQQRHRAVIVGAGFGGLSAAQALARAEVDVILIDRQNHHTFQPLLYQVATAGLSPADIAYPIRSILRSQANADVVLAEVTGIDLDGRKVVMNGRSLAYDTLVLATGASHAYFGHDDWALVAPGLKTIDDATALRRNILIAFEMAETETDPEERRRLQTFVVIGGGPTGVEMAGAIAELAKRTMAADFRHIDPRKTRVVLIEGGNQLLAAFDSELSDKARKALEQIGVDVRVGRPVIGCDQQGVSFGDTRIESRTIIWAAGVKASPAGEWLAAEADRVGRVKVGPDLTLPGHPEVFVIGDTAHVMNDAGKPLPGIAAVAKQQGSNAGKRIKARLEGKVLPEFRYRDSGSMATIGRKSAVAHIGRFRFSGWFAWLIWCVAHVYFLIGFRNRLVVVANWTWNYMTFQRGARLITGVGNTQPKL